MAKSTRWVLIVVGAVSGCLLLFAGIEHFRTLLTAGVPGDDVLTSKVTSALWPLVIGLWLVTGCILAAVRTRRSG